MTDRNPPYDLAAEMAVLGAMLISSEARTLIAEEALVSGDFYHPAHVLVFRAMADLMGRHAPVDALTVRDELARSGDLDAAGGDGYLLELQASTPSISHAVRHARIVADHKARRNCIVAAADITSAAYDLRDPAEIVSAGVAALGAVDMPLSGPARGLGLLRDLSEVDADKAQPWVCPGLFREKWRVVAVGPEGFGKSVAATQLVTCIAAGVHPFAFTPIEPVPTLLIALENRADTIAHHYQLVDRALYRLNPDREHAFVLHRPEGIDLRSARVRAELRDTLARVRPGLVVISPIYKAFSVQRNENYEQATGEVQRILDGLIEEFGFALFCEHHANKASGGVRNLDPSGSALWLRWPEFGFKLKPDGNPQVFTKLELARYRGDRVPAAWPSEIVKGREWPWEGVWPEGTFR